MPGLIITLHWQIIDIDIGIDLVRHQSGDHNENRNIKLTSEISELATFGHIMATILRFPSVCENVSIIVRNVYKADSGMILNFRDSPHV